MSELQDTIIIAILTGAFTLSGISIGALLEHWRERWQHDQEKEKRQEEIEDTNKRSFLSPLYFYIYKSVILSSLNTKLTFEEFKNELIYFSKSLDTIEPIENLMKNNMHVLPVYMNISLGYYITCLNLFQNGVSDLLQTFNMLSEKQNRMQVPKGFIEGFAKLTEAHNNMGEELSASIYSFMKFNTLPKEKPFEVKKIAKEIDEAFELMKTSLSAAIEKNQ